MPLDVSLGAEVERGMRVANGTHDWADLIDSMAGLPCPVDRDGMDGVMTKPLRYSDLSEQDRPPLGTGEISDGICRVLGG